MKKLPILPLVLSVLSSCNRPAYKDGLVRLDNVLSNAQHYAREREAKIRTAESELQLASSDEARYEVYGKVFSLTYDYQFDKAITALANQEKYAPSEELALETRLRTALLCCSSGYFVECSELISSIDTTSFTSDSQLYLYYQLRHRFYKDFREYLHPGVGGELDEKAGWYRGQLIEYLPDDSFLRGKMLLSDLIEQHNFDGAREVGDRLLGTLSPDTHDYAIICFYMGELYMIMGDRDKALEYYIESAICDVELATMDNASLQCIALALLDSDVNRSFRYTRTALDDAFFYNSRLRPMQIARNLPEIERHYEAITGRDIRVRTILLLVMSVLVVVSLVLLLRLWKYQSRLHKAVDQLSEANAAKEEFLALFLSKSSSYLDKLRHHLGRSQMEVELKEFYAAFDEAFVKLYPAFVDEFNELLVPEARIILKKGESLNTQLRIFALIRLGIDQPAQIAHFLRYSPTTIYNYRTQTKAAALCGKDDFEESVKRIAGRG